MLGETIVECVFVFQNDAYSASWGARNRLNPECQIPVRADGYCNRLCLKRRTSPHPSQPSSGKPTVGVSSE